LKLQAQAAQGGGDAAKLADEQKKLANNVATGKLLQLLSVIP